MAVIVKLCLHVNPVTETLCVTSFDDDDDVIRPHVLSDASMMTPTQTKVAVVEQVVVNVDRKTNLKKKLVVVVFVGDDQMGGNPCENEFCFT